MADLIDTYDATAKETDILSGKTAYAKKGKITGTITSQAGGSHVPTSSSKVVAQRGKYLTSDIIIPGDTNLKPENIKSGVTIFGVKGNAEPEKSDRLPDGVYTINVKTEVPGDGKVSGGGIASRGTTITVEAEDEWHSTFVDWRENGEKVSESREYTFNVDSNKNLIATFDSLPIYTIFATANPKVGGIINGTGKYRETESVTLFAEENPGYDFVNYEEDGEPVSDSNEYEFISENNRNLIANFSGPITYTISANAEPKNSGVIVGTGDYPKRAYVNLQAIPNEGYSLLSWDEDNIPVSNSLIYSFQALKSANLTARFGKLDQVGNRNVGDIVLLNVGGVQTEFIVVHKGNPSTSMYDSSCNGVWLLMKDCYTNMPFSRSNVGDYLSSDINEYINGEFFELFDSYIQDNIKQVKIPYSKGTTVYSKENGLLVNVFVLSCTEVGGDASFSSTNTEGSRLSYFYGINTSTETEKRIAIYDGKSCEWWLRSPSISRTTGAIGVTTAGRVTGFVNSSYSIGVRPAVILTEETLVVSVS